jgi:hypothetical protein
MITGEGGVDMAKKRVRDGRSGEPDGWHRPRGRSDDGNAFLPDPDGGPVYARDDLAELLAEDFVMSATSNADADGEEHEGVVDEELGGPFVETTGQEEFAEGTDDSNPEDATAEPLPRAMAGPPRSVR